MREWIVAGAIFVLALAYLVASAIRERRRRRRAEDAKRRNGRRP